MISKKQLLILPKDQMSKPIVYHIVKDYNVKFHIIRAKITPTEEGHMVIDMVGDEKNIEQAISFIKEQGIKVNGKSEGMLWEFEKCTGCGGCLPHCPTKALYIVNAKTREVDFNSSKCIECLSCIQVCPYHACSSIF